MRKRLLGSWPGRFGLAVLAAGSMQVARPAAAVGQNQVSSVVVPASKYRVVLDKYCVTCHNGRLRTAGLELDTVGLSNLGQHAELWEKVVRKLEGREMPPAGRPRPDEATYDGFASWLQASLDAAAVAHPNPGRPVLHRLNRTEYANAIRDLLALEIKDVTTLLPPDDSTHGFDNIGDALGMSALLLESYVVAARKISRLAVGNPAIPLIAETYVGAHDETQDYHQDGMPFGTRGGLHVQHHFPVDGEYQVRIRLERSQRDDVRGLQEPHDMELAIDGHRVKVFKLDGGPHMYEQEVYDGESLALTADDNLFLKVPVTAGPHEITATFPVKTFAVAEDLTKPLLRSYLSPNSVAGLPAVSKIIVTGPFDVAGSGDSPNRRRIFTCQPSGSTDEMACAKEILSTLARRAYRGSITDADVQVLLGFYEAGRQSGGFEAGIELALWRVFASPKFIFRFEFDPPDIAPGGIYPISDLELASRLSFFLWSSIPDDQLLDLAARGELRSPGVLEQQVRRMLLDAPRASAGGQFCGTMALPSESRSHRAGTEGVP